MRHEKIISIQSIVIASLFVTSLLGCGAVIEDERGLRMGVSGTVSIDGDPVKNARITFTPEAGNGSIKAVGLITDGSYKILPEHGSLVGKMRVEIQSELMEVEQLESIRQGNTKMKVNLELAEIPAIYNKKSTLTADVSEDAENNVFDFHLKATKK